MRERFGSVLTLVGAPSRVARARVGSLRRRPILLSCWGLFWILVIWDVYLSKDTTKGNTWSEVIRLASGTNPILPWLLGSITTHLFHSRDALHPIFDPDAASRHSAAAA